MGVKFSQLPLATSVASDDYIAVLDTSEMILKKTPISHASSGTEYGMATPDEYGHVKVIQTLTYDNDDDGAALAARQGKIIMDNLGQREYSDIAAYDHALGTYFIYKDQFVKTTVAIAASEEIGLGINVEASTISQAIGLGMAILPVNPTVTPTQEGAIWME